MRDLSKEKHLRFRVGIYEVFFENPNDIDYRKKSVAIIGGYTTPPTAGGYQFTFLIEGL